MHQPFWFKLKCVSLSTWLFYRYIIGKKGETRKRLESDTKTSINIPKQGVEGQIGRNHLKRELLTMPFSVHWVFPPLSDSYHRFLQSCSVLGTHASWGSGWWFPEKAAFHTLLVIPFKSPQNSRRIFEISRRSVAAVFTGTVEVSFKQFFQQDTSLHIDSRQPKHFSL